VRRCLKFNDRLLFLLLVLIFATLSLALFRLAFFAICSALAVPPFLRLRLAAWLKVPLQPA
jgi:hypothetical protein